MGRSTHGGERPVTEVLMQGRGLVTAVTLQHLADLVGGQIVGDAGILCSDARPLQEAGSGQVTLIDDPHRIQLAERCGVAAVILRELVPDAQVTQLIVEQPHAAFARVVRHFRPQTTYQLRGVSPHAMIHATAVIASDCAIHAGVHVGAGAVVGAGTTLMPGVVVMPHCRIGQDCRIHPGVVLYEHTVLEDRVVIHAGSVIGAHGFGYRLENNRHAPTSQLGYVHIEVDVELGACVTIDRGTYGTTRIGAGTKIDNQVMIAHNCQIGRHNLICSQVGIAGSCQTGDYVVMAGQVGLKDHVSLGDHAIVGAQAGVMDDLPGGEVYLGSPATTQRDQMHILAVQRKLPEMRRQLKQLSKQVAQLTAALAATQPSAAGEGSGLACTQEAPHHPADTSAPRAA